MSDIHQQIRKLKVKPKKFSSILRARQNTQTVQGNI